MFLRKPMYRRDYTGEWLFDARTGRMKKTFVSPRNLFHRSDDTGKAMVIGNGKSRQNDIFDLFCKTNQSRPLPGYKMMYACNYAAADLSADYYIINTRAVMGVVIDETIWSQFFMPWDMYLDYTKPNLIPHVQGLDSGSYAAYLACFDGNDEVFLFGFDGQDGTGNNNVYAGQVGYDHADTPVDPTEMQNNLTTVMSVYKDVRFYRVGNGITPSAWSALPNFQNVTYRDAVLLGDF
jgi:hypothetical protein